jgi:Na+-driven multidrug efflux pump
VVELILALVVSAWSKDVKLKLSCMFIRSKLLFQDFLKRAMPATLNDVSWGLAFSMYSVIIGQFLGTDMVAANSFTSLVRTFGTVLCFSVASGGGILLGQIMGDGRMEEAEKSASALLKLTILSGIIGGLIVLAAMPFVLRFANLTETGRGYLKGMLLINTYYVMGQAVNTTLIAGVFRAGGDSRFGFICDTIDMWCYAVPLGFLAAAVLKLPPMWVYFLLCTDEFVKWPWVIGHYKSKKWLRNITRENVV